MNQFIFNIEEKNGYNLVSLKGRIISSETIDDFLTQITNALEKNKNVILNLENLEYLNSSGLNALINILTKSRVKGGETIITNVPDSINKLLLISKLNTVFEIRDTVEDAEEELLASLKNS